MSDITSDILALSFDGLSSPTIHLKLIGAQEGTHPYGWGMAWFPSDSKAAMVAKDPVARNTESLMDVVSDWENFRSSVFFCKVRGAAQGYTHHETQPFSTSFAGQDWLFMHNGDLDRVQLGQIYTNRSLFLEPRGRTDSELAFLFLLSKVKETEARNLYDVPPETLLSWFEQLDTLGSADMCISDGITVACYYGTHSERELYYSQIQPPNAPHHFHAETAELALDDPRDVYRSSVVFSSQPFDAGTWQKMAPGQLILARCGHVVWNNQAQHAGTASQLSLPLQGKPGATKTSAQIAGRAESDAGGPQRLVANLRAVTQAPDGTALGYRTFDITHITEYDYDAAVEHSTHVFRLHPVEDELQELVNSQLLVSAAGEEIRYEDVFGNVAVHYSIHRPYTRLSVQSQSRVRVYARVPDDHSLSRRQSTIPLVWMPWQRQMMMPYLMPSELPESQLAELTAYAMSFVQRNQYHVLDTLEDMNLSIYRDYTYVPGSTSLNTTPFEVFTTRRGVCQDFANLLICLARLLGIPARYRMGYIYTGANYQNKIQSDASHAWVEIYLPYVGWRGFDPTNGCMVMQDHVRVACGRSYVDATPTSGTLFKGGGGEVLNVQVKMTEVFE